MNISLNNFLRNCISLLVSISIIFLMVSCTPPNEKAHPAYSRAENAMKKKDYVSAADGYQEYLCFNRRSAITNYKLGKLYGESLDNPFLSAYHFREYLKYEPQSPDKDAIETWIVAAEKRFAKKIQEKYPENFASQSELITLRENQQKLVNYVLKIKKQNAELLKKLHGETIETLDTKSGDTFIITDDVQEIYTVQPGDNLQKISRSVYGTSKYYKLIFEANRNTMKSESELNIGQKLQIPKLKRNSEQLYSEQKEEIH